MSDNFRIILFFFSSVFFIGCDRTTKILARAHLRNEPPSYYLNDIFVLHYTENTGAALSLGSNLPQPYNFILLSLLPMIFIILLIAYAVSRVHIFNKVKMLAFSLLIAGGIGNIIDRVMFDRHVTDFMILQAGKFHTGIFNFADVCVMSGVLGILFFYKDRTINEAQG